MNRKKYSDNIIMWLTQIVTSVKLGGKLNLNDLNIHAENFFRDLLNRIYGLNLENINFTKGKNADTIDLGDTDKRIAIQVTSNDSLDKLRNTIKNFTKNGLLDQYDKLQFLIIKADRKFSRKTNFDVEVDNKFEFSISEDILTISKINAEINNKSTDEIKTIHDFLEKEIPSGKVSPTTANEVETIIDLIAYLSGNKLETVPEEIEPDPDGKIYKRFKDYSRFLTEEYNQLVTIYKSARDQAEQKFGLDTARHLTITNFLRTKSDYFLRQTENDPLKALEALVEYFSSELSTGEKEYDEAAIRFYLVDELIKCNIFPNEQHIK